MQIKKTKIDLISKLYMYKNNLPSERQYKNTENRYGFWINGVRMEIEEGAKG